MIEYRPFRNFDPPHLTELWNYSGLGTGAVHDLSNDMFDMLVLSEPYFDPNGLIVAWQGREAVGFVHAGFGTKPDGCGLSREIGVIGAVVVDAQYRRQGIGRELVKRAEDYLRSHGAQSIDAGESPRRDPFYLGLYGSAESCGFLESDAAAAPFFLASGYAAAERYVVFRREISRRSEPFDPRVVQIKRSMKFAVLDRPPTADWWWMTRHGRFLSLTFVLSPNDGGPSPTQVTCWDMELHAMTRGERTVGITDLFTAEPGRRKGYSRILLGEVLRRLREDGATHVEVVVKESNAPALALFHGLGFQPADTGVVYRRPGR